MPEKLWDINSQTNVVLDTDVWWAEATQSSKIAWEDLTAWNSLHLWKEILAQEDSSTSNWWSQSISFAYPARRYLWQTFTTTTFNIIDDIKIYLKTAISGHWDIRIKIYETDKTTLLWTSSNAINEDTLTSSFAQYTFNFWWLELSASTQYFFTIESTTAWSNDTDETYYNNSDTYSWWEFWKWNWSIWEQYWDWYDLNFEITTHKIASNWQITWRVYKTDASDPTKINFIWFANETITSWNAINVNTSWVDSNQSWLTTWEPYYLSNTPWSISTSSWTNLVKVGKAISTSEIEIFTWWKEAVDWWSLVWTATYSSETSKTINITEDENAIFKIEYDLNIVCWWSNWNFRLQICWIQTNYAKRTFLSTAVWNDPYIEMDTNRTTDRNLKGYIEVWWKASKSSPTEYFIWLKNNPLWFYTEWNVFFMAQVKKTSAFNFDSMTLYSTKPLTWTVKIYKKTFLA